MSKLTILVLCALVGTALPARHHHRSSSRSRAEPQVAADANINLGLGLGGLPVGLFGADGKPSKSGSYKWSYSGAGGAPELVQDPSAAIKLLMGADGKPSKSGSYKWSYSTKGGAADVGRGNSQANAQLNLGPLGGLANGIANGIGGALGGAGAAINGGLGIIGGLEGAADAAAAIKGKIGRSSRHSRKDPLADVKVNLAGLGAGLTLGGSTRNANAVASLTLNGVKFIQIGTKYYWIDSAKAMNWHAAHSTCRRNNAQLATITSEEELKALNMLLLSQKATAGKNFWLAGNDLAEEGKFEWVSNGKPMTYAKWSTGQPDNYGSNENCVGVWIQNKEYLMNDWPCSAKLNVICEADTSCMYARK